MSVANFYVLAVRKLGRAKKRKRGEGKRRVSFSPLPLPPLSFFYSHPNFRAAKTSKFTTEMLPTQANSSLKIIEIFHQPFLPCFNLVNGHEANTSILPANENTIKHTFTINMKNTAKKDQFKKFKSLIIFTTDLAKVSDRRNNFFMVSVRPTTSVSSIDLNTFFMLSN